ncbi:MAG: hypothetical protein ICV68_05555, partial [Pyrinomonadaceae bacterium]|nr:hypothetical protein [Pyrinomonadaceae bacterium]
MLTTRTWILLIAAALLVTAGALNFEQRWTHKSPPTDGITWVQQDGQVIAQAVEPGSAGSRAGILPGDHLFAVTPDGGRPEEIDLAHKVQIYLSEAGVGGHLTYSIERPSYPEETRYYEADLYDLDAIPNWTSHELYINIIGLVWLFVGLFVLFKQGGRAPFVLHFATLCLVAFVFHFYQSTGRLKDLDIAIAFLKPAALILFAPLFLHFCAIYPVRHRLSKRRWLAALLYVPASILLVIE